MRAKFPGRCHVTGLQIRVGDEIVSDGKGGWRLPSTDPRIPPDPRFQPGLRELHAQKVRRALARRPDLTNREP